MYESQIVVEMALLQLDSRVYVCMYVCMYMLVLATPEERHM
jgi:hypothetical protein